MCRFTAYIGKPILLADLITRPSRSVIRQSYNSQERARGPNACNPCEAFEAPWLNGDGFGVGWYQCEALAAQYAKDDPSPCVFTSLKPAWNSANLERIAAKVRCRRRCRRLSALLRRAATRCYGLLLSPIAVLPLALAASLAAKLSRRFALTIFPC